MGKQPLLRAMMLACAASIAAVGAGYGNEFQSSEVRGDRDRNDRFRHCDPRSYGAVNDGKTDNTTALQTAIDHCAQSGGVVSITGGGTYVTGPIELRSRVYLRIDAPTVLKNTTDHTRYQPAFIGYPFRFANNPSVTGTGPSLPGKPEAMISAVNVEESGIIGDRWRRR
jgi:polygalacturonase